MSVDSFADITITGMSLSTSSYFINDRSSNPSISGMYKSSKSKSKSFSGFLNSSRASRPFSTTVASYEHKFMKSKSASL